MIELAVVMALAVALMVVGIWGIGSIFSSRLTADSEKLAAVIRYISHYSVRHNVPCRLVLEMESGVFYGEYRRGKTRFQIDADEMKAALKGESKKTGRFYEREEEEKKKE